MDDASTEERRRAWIALAQVSGLGPRRAELLLSRLGSPEAVLAAPEKALRGAGRLDADTARAIARGGALRRAERAIARARREGFGLIVRGDAAYPRPLREIPDPPLVLWTRGDPGPPDAVAVAVVGSRRATPYGLRVAEGLGSALAAAGVTVVSGMARGVDSAAHEGALAGEGRTLAVLGSGLADLYPPESEALAARIAASGAVLSELPPDEPPRKGHFPRRNRIIAGLVRALVVVEAAARSGSLITARLALEQGREVGAVPGPVHNETSTGPHCLIRDGAFLVQRAEDVLEAIGGTRLPARTGMDQAPAVDLDSLSPPLGRAERSVFELLDPTSPPPSTASSPDPSAPPARCSRRSSPSSSAGCSGSFPAACI